LPPICISVTGNTPEELLESARRAFDYSRFVELRLDWLPNVTLALPLIPDLLESSSQPSGMNIRPPLRLTARRQTQRLAGTPVLQATCRRQANGGRFAGDVAEQVEVLKRAAAAGCHVLDLEIESAEAAGLAAVEQLRLQALVIVSWHDFHGTSGLQTAVRRLRQLPADYYKLVTTATRQTDNCAALHVLSSVASKEPTRKRWIVFCMDQAGIPSRVLALSRGSAFVYASRPQGNPGIEPALIPLRRTKGMSKPVIGEIAQGTHAGTTSAELPSAEPAAPGQIGFQTLRDVYRAEKLTLQTRIYGLVGYPIGHSIGAAIHNAAFRSKKLNAVYLPLLTSDVKDFWRAANRYPLAGFSVTIPHKQKILRLVDRADSVAKLAGAANTVRYRRQWEATNTDVEGIVAPLRKSLHLKETEPVGSEFRTVVIGTGGAARAALVALGKLGCRAVVITGRNPVKASGLAAAWRGRVIALQELEHEHFELMIHATSVGMWPHAEQCLLRPEQIDADIIFDLVYNPAETRLLQIARQRRCQTISGLEMFLEQAARQFEYWTGVDAPRRLMRKTAEHELARFLNDSAVAEGQRAES